MTVVAAGSGLVLRVGENRVALRALREVTLDGDWHIPVLASAPALTWGGGTAEMVTDSGVVTMDAHLAVSGGMLVLRPGASTRQVAVQRRQDVRAPLVLPLRGVVVTGQARSGLDQVGFEGSTLSVSGGGLEAAVDLVTPRLPVGTAVFVEITLPEGMIVPAVLCVVEHRPRRVRGKFVDIAAADRERLVRMVFAQERHSLAHRPRCQDTHVT